eukprot:1547976-Pleurochrysis_carterae.AAC.3
MQGYLSPIEPARTGCTVAQMQRVNSRNGIARIVTNEDGRGRTKRKRREDARRCLMQGHPRQISRHAQAAQFNKISTHASRLTLERPNEK